MSYSEHEVRGWLTKKQFAKFIYDFTEKDLTQKEIINLIAKYLQYKLD